MRISGIGSLLLAALTGALLLSELAAAVVIPTSEGNGADAYLSNDSNRGPAVMHGEKVHLEIRQISGSRLRLLYLRFDLSGVAGDLSGATITLNGTTINEDRPISYYGLEEGPAAGAGENWNESTISYSSASGLDPASPLGSFAFTADATSSALASTTGSAVGDITTDPDPALDAFLGADTNGLVTFIVVLPPPVTGTEYFFFTSKEGGGAPVLNLPNANLAAGDSDEDGLSDLWEDQHFGNGDGTATPAELILQSGLDDPDGDAFTNMQEEAGSTDPTDPVAYPGADVFYVAPDGDDANPGTIDEPFATLGRVQDEVSAGTIVYFRGGTYAVQESEVEQYSGIFARVFLLDQSGAEGSPIRYWAYPGEEPIFDLSAVNPSGYRIYTFYVTGSWLHFRGLTVIGVQVNITTHTQSICFDNEGSHNIYERLVMRDNMAIGMWIGNGSNNLVLNCDAYRNWDSVSENGTGGNVDGFGCHGSADEGNVFRGCRAWLNSDDGFDLINQKEPVVIEHCWAAYNGFDHNFVSRGDGNGFKAGGFGSTPAAQLPNPIPRHVVRDSLAVGNKQSGFYANHHPGGVSFVGNSALRNKRNFNLLCRTADNVTDVDGYDHFLRNNLGFNASLSELSDADLPSCDSSHNYWDLPVTVDGMDFQSIDESFLTAPRQASGELPVVPLMRLVSGSDLIDAGVDTGEPFVGLVPDLGCYEDELIELGSAGFELPLGSLVATRPGGAVWSFSGVAGLLPDPLAPEGEQVGFLQADGKIFQGCDGFVPGSEYHVHLLAAAPAGAATLELQVDGVPFSTADIGSGGFVSVDRRFTASSTHHAMGFAATGEVRIDDVRVSVVQDDSDGDALSDAWEFLWFDSLAQGPSDDPDRDGSTNRVEEVLGLDPNSGSEAFRCVLVSKGTLQWTSAVGVSFTVERSADLLSWGSLGQVTGEDGVTNFTDPEPLEDEAFYRVSFAP